LAPLLAAESAAATPDGVPPITKTSQSDDVALFSARAMAGLTALGTVFKSAGARGCRFFHAHAPTHSASKGTPTKAARRAKVRLRRAREAARRDAEDEGSEEESGWRVGIEHKTLGARDLRAQLPEKPYQFAARSGIAAPEEASGFVALLLIAFT